MSLVIYCYLILLQEGVKLGEQCDEDEGPEQWQTTRQLLNALDRPSKSPLGRSEQESLGLFWALDELSTDAVVTDVTVVEKLFSSYYTRGQLSKQSFS